jgi:hypothetical protein
MFTLPSEFGQRIEQGLAGRVCTSPDGSYIRRSFGRRRAGRPQKYTVHLSIDQAFVIHAFDDVAAVDIANERAAQQMRAADKCRDWFDHDWFAQTIPGCYIVGTCRKCGISR